jgi:hypothetical protein
MYENSPNDTELALGEKRNSEHSQKANGLYVVSAGIRTQWPSGRSGCMSGRLLGSQFQITPKRGVLNVECCGLMVSAAGRSLVQRSSTEDGVSECDSEASMMRRTWTRRTVASQKTILWQNALTYYLLIPLSRILLARLTGLELVKNFPPFYGTRRFITAFTISRRLSLSWASPIQSTSPHFFSWKSHPNITHPFTTGSPQWSLSPRFPYQNPIHAPRLPHLRYVPPTPPISFFSILLPAQYWVRIIKLHIMKFSPFPCYFVHLGRVHLLNKNKYLYILLVSVNSPK